MIEYEKLVIQIKAQLIVEAEEASRRQGELLERERKELLRDSASEADSEDDWYEYAEQLSGHPFWFSPSRNEKVHTRPNKFAREKSMIGLGIKVYWPLEDAWFEGTIVKFCATKGKHRIDYFDGDHEWLAIDHMDPSQLQIFNSCWLMYENYIASERAMRASLFIRQRFQKYSIEYFCWRTGWIKHYNDNVGLFYLVYDDFTDEWLDLYQAEDEIQIQDRRSQQWYTLGTFFFGANVYDPPPRVIDYLMYDETMVNSAAFSDLNEIENGLMGDHDELESKPYEDISGGGGRGGAFRRKKNGRRKRGGGWRLRRWRRRE
jgi:hypothetical protein